MSVTLYPYNQSQTLLSILHKLTLQNELPNFVTNNVFLDKKVKIQQQPDPKKSNIKTLELKPEPLAPKADASFLHHRVY